MIDCVAPGASASAMLRALFCLRRGSQAVNVGAVMETPPLNAFWLMTNRIGLSGSVWFSTGEGLIKSGQMSAVDRQRPNR
jgi:threonine dehydrogenase-like Zn-dependent dehydrogenase